MTPIHTKYITDDDARYAADRLNDINARRTRRAEAAGSFVGILVLGILAALAIIHWATPCADAALCMAAVITPTRRGPAGAVLRTLERWRLRLALADAELALDRVQADLELLPRVQRDLQRDIDALRVKLATLQPVSGAQP